MDPRYLRLDSQHRINSLSQLEDMTNQSLFGKLRGQELFRKNFKPIQSTTHLLKKTSPTRAKLRKRNNNLPVRLSNKLRILIKTKIWKHRIRKSWRKSSLKLCHGKDHLSLQQVSQSHQRTKVQLLTSKLRSSGFMATKETKLETISSISLMDQLHTMRLLLALYMTKQLIPKDILISTLMKSLLLLLQMTKEQLLQEKLGLDQRSLSGMESLCKRFKLSKESSMRE